MDLKDHEGNTALWLGLQYITVASDPSINPFDDDAPVVNGTSFDENSFAARLIQRGSDPNAPDASGPDSHKHPFTFYTLLSKNDYNTVILYLKVMS